MVSSAGTFRDIHGRLVRLPLPSREDQDAVAEFRSELNGRLAPAAVLERIRKHTALIAEARRAATGCGRPRDLQASTRSNDSGTTHVDPTDDGVAR
jgi:hypothetical protein